MTPTMTPTKIAYMATGNFLVEMVAKMILGPEEVERWKTEWRASLEFYEAAH